MFLMIISSTMAISIITIIMIMILIKEMFEITITYNIVLKRRTIYFSNNNLDKDKLITN